METLEPLTMRFAYLAFSSFFFFWRDGLWQANLGSLLQVNESIKVKFISSSDQDASACFFFLMTGESLFPGFHFSTFFFVV